MNVLPPPVTIVTPIHAHSHAFEGSPLDMANDHEQFNEGKRAPGCDFAARTTWVEQMNAFQFVFGISPHLFVSQHA